MRIAPVTQKLLPMLAILLFLGACSAPGGSSAPSGSAGSASAKPTNPDAGLLTGSQLKALLAPPSFFPAGFAIQPGGTRDTGRNYNSPSTTRVTRADCKMLGDTSWTMITGINGVSFAQNDYVDHKNSDEIAQEIDIYRGETSKTVLASIGQVAAECPTFQDAGTNSIVTVTEKALPAVGDGAYQITLTDPKWHGGTTLIAARADTAVITVLANNGTDSGLSTAISLTSLLVVAVENRD